MSIKTIFTDLASYIAAFVAKHRTIVIAAGVAASLLGGINGYAWYAAEPGRHHDYWHVPTKQPIPQPLQEAGRITFEIDRHEATWTAEMDELTKLIEGQKPGEFDLSKEIATTDAFSAYVAHLLRAGEAAVETFVRMERTTRKVNEILKRAPATFRETAAFSNVLRTRPGGPRSSRTTRRSPISGRRRPKPLRTIKMMSRPTSTATSWIILKSKMCSWNVC